MTSQRFTSERLSNSKQFRCKMAPSNWPLIESVNDIGHLLVPNDTEHDLIGMNQKENRKCASIFSLHRSSKTCVERRGTKTQKLFAQLAQSLSVSLVFPIGRSLRLPFYTMFVLFWSRHVVVWLLFMTFRSDNVSSAARFKSNCKYFVVIHVETPKNHENQMEQNCRRQVVNGAFGHFAHCYCLFTCNSAPFLFVFFFRVRTYFCVLHLLRWPHNQIRCVTFLFYVTQTKIFHKTMSAHAHREYAIAKRIDHRSISTL